MPRSSKKGARAESEGRETIGDEQSRPECQCRFGRPGLTYVPAFQAAQHNPIKDRLPFMRFLGLGPADAAPDANTIWTFWEVLACASISGEPAAAVLFKRFDAMVKAFSYFAMGGQLIDAAFVATPKRRGRIAVPDGPSNTPRPNQTRMALRRRPISRSRPWTQKSHQDRPAPWLDPEL